MESTRFSQCEPRVLMRRNEEGFVEIGILNAATLRPGQGAWLDTGVEVVVPSGFVGLVRATELAIKSGVDLEGTILPGKPTRLRIRVTNFSTGVVSLSSGKPLAVIVTVPLLVGAVLTTLE